MAVYAKSLGQTLEEKFDGDEPIAILEFLRSFKESADHNRISEGAAARLLPYFLKGSAKEEYKSYLKRGPRRQAGLPADGAVPVGDIRQR